MNYTADTSFFIRLGEGAPRAVQIWGEIIEGKGRLTVPVIALAELKRNYLKKGLVKEIEEMIHLLNNSQKISLLSLTPDLASMSANVSHAYNLTIIDAIVATSSMVSGFTDLLTSDPVFFRVQKDGKIKVISV
ncbi:PIN domain-containing protein [Candidatus Woesearchaeota archaeon]|nr:PIN domain-containing protein [Candidatus Woesearchaeota archaeon]